MITTASITDYNPNKHKLFFLCQYRQIVMLEILGPDDSYKYKYLWSCILRDDNDNTQVAKIWLAKDGTTLWLDHVSSVPSGNGNEQNILFDSAENSFWNDSNGIIVGTGDLRDLSDTQSDLDSFLLLWEIPVEEQDGSVHPIYIENTAVFEINIYSQNSPSKK
ncbi:MAG TPA: hypothetical protein VFU15_01125 [Bacteroidia bacterium]|nr:hypothetical protein [Bacteroidia bacterium]